MILVTRPTTSRRVTLHGIESHPDTTGVVEYHPDPDTVPYDDPEPTVRGDATRRFTDGIGDERATLELASSLIEARQTDVSSAVDGETGFPLRPIGPCARVGDTGERAVMFRSVGSHATKIDISQEFLQISV